MAVAADYPLFELARILSFDCPHQETNIQIKLSTHIENGDHSILALWLTNGKLSHILFLKTIILNNTQDFYQHHLDMFLQQILSCSTSIEDFELNDFHLVFQDKHFLLQII